MDHFVRTKAGNLLGKRFAVAVQCGLQGAIDIKNGALGVCNAYRIAHVIERKLDACVGNRGGSGGGHLAAGILHHQRDALFLAWKLFNLMVKAALSIFLKQ